MKTLMAVLMLMLVSLSYADEIKLEIKPSKPVMGEVFQAYFRIFTEENAEPSINFVPSGLEVVGKANQGVSTRTVYSNGKLSVTREMIVVYELVANRLGTASLRDITVQVGSQTLKHPSVNLTIVKEPEQAQDVFVMVDVSKKSLFVGEGVTARYYIYHKFPLSNLDVKKYPKLNNFLKRFLQEAEQSERVSVDGEVYLRSQIYAAKLFPEKAGDLKIDSLQLTATVPNVRANDPFAAFGMSRDFKTKTVTSDVVTINVKPLPQPIPDNFSGLIGKHDFQLQFGSSRLIVNQPLEVKLTISGSGALENLEAPKLISHPGLEEFESNGDLKIQDADTATKTFDYTFLAKENLKIPASQMTLTYFDIGSEKYLPIQLTIPEIVVAGGSAETPKRTDPQSPKEEEKPGRSALPSKPLSLNAPLQVDTQQIKGFLPYVNFGLAIIAVLIALGWFIKSKRLPRFQGAVEIPADFKRGNFNFGEFSRWISPLIQKTGKSPVAVIKDAPLDEATRNYFVDILSTNDYKDYASRKVDSSFTYESTHFKNLGRLIERAKNESPSQPS